MKRDGRPVGVICAMAEEMALLQTHLVSATETAVAGLQFRSGLLFDVPAVLTPAGIGKVNAALVATVLADRFQARAILFSGVAGGLDPALGIGDVVIADPLVQHDYGAIVAGRMRPYRPGAMPIGARRAKLGFALPAGLRAIAEGAVAGLVLPQMPAAATGGAPRRPHVHFGAVLTGDQFVACETTRDRLYAEHAALAVEMEGAAVAQVAASFALPWLVVRAVSDLAGKDSARDFAAFFHAASAGAAEVVRHLLPVLAG